MNLRKLTTLALASLLILAGGSQLSAYRGSQVELSRKIQDVSEGRRTGSALKPSPNLHIVPKTKKTEKKTEIGFTAHLARSAKGFGRTFLSLVTAPGSERVKSAYKRPARPRGIIEIAQSKHIRQHLTVAASCCDMRQNLIGAESICVGGYPEDTVLPADFGQIPGIGPPAEFRALPHQKRSISPDDARLYTNYSILLRLLKALRPVLHAQQPELTTESHLVTSGARPLTAKPGFSANAGAEAEPVSAVRLSFDYGSVPALRALSQIDTARMYFTIDPLKPSTLLTDGPMGARSALRRDRSRDNRPQSV